MASLNLEELLDEKDIARLTKRSLASVRRDRLLGRGVPVIRIGGSVRYSPEALRSYLKSCEAGGHGREAATRGRHQEEAW